jgi:tetrahydromethanopterin S-methyltransferase subunit A
MPKTKENGTMETEIKRMALESQWAKVLDDTIVSAIEAAADIIEVNKLEAFHTVSSRAELEWFVAKVVIKNCLLNENLAFMLELETIVQDHIAWLNSRAAGLA